MNQYATGHSNASQSNNVHPPMAPYSPKTHPLHPNTPASSPIVLNHHALAVVSHPNTFHTSSLQSPVVYPPVARQSGYHCVASRPRDQHLPNHYPPAHPLSQVPYSPALPPPLTIIQQEPPRPFTPPMKETPPEESPDPLALVSGSSSHTTSAVVTPKKRKLVLDIQSPSIKRLQSTKSVSSLSIGSTSESSTKTPQSVQTSVPVTPSSSMMSFTNSDRTVYSTPTVKRIVNKAYVSVPPIPYYLTPKSARKLDSDDLGGYGSEESSPSSPTKRTSIHDSVRSSARRTGDRDDRGMCNLSYLSNPSHVFLGPLEKLLSLIEDIFEAEDTLPTEIEASDLNHDFFSPLSSDYTRPLLAPAVVRKLTKYIGYITRPSKRLRQPTGGIMGTPRSKGRVSDVEPQQLSRLLKILDRSVKVGEDLDPFPHVTPSISSSAKSSPKKASTKKGGNKTKKNNDNRSRSVTPKEPQEGVDDDSPSTPAVPTESDFNKLVVLLDTARDSILAADCCIALLGSDRLPKQVCRCYLSMLIFYIKNTTAVFRRADYDLSECHQEPTDEDSVSFCGGICRNWNHDKRESTFTKPCQEPQGVVC